jgi:hypothetical protein
MQEVSGSIPLTSTKIEELSTVACYNAQLGSKGYDPIV